jgi:phospholipase/lecithinase/hemolysin
MIHRFLPRAVFALACCSSALLAASATDAAGFSAEYVFGDSLSDNGNLASVTGAFPDPPSFDNSFTNGPVAVQLLAESLGLSANASLWLTAPTTPKGTNYAVGGATAATGADLPGTNININLPSQVGAYDAFASDHADPNALYVIMIGGNDVRDAALGAGADAVTNGVSDEVKSIQKLASEGADHFLVVGVPNVGLIPEFTEAVPPDPAAVTAATQFSIDYNTDLAEGLEEADLPSGTMLTDFNLFTFNQDNIVDKASELGFTNTTDPCYTFLGVPDSTATTPGCGADAQKIDHFLYWNIIHPTARVQAIWAEGLRSAVPEPSTWAMMVIGFVGLGFAGYRRGARARAAA